MRIHTILAMTATALLAGCGGYDESTPEGFYMAYVQAWADKDVDKIIDMHFTSENRPNGCDYSRSHTEKEIRAWMDDNGEKTPQAVCKKTLREVKSFYYSENVSPDIKVLSGKNAAKVTLDPGLHIEKIDGKWKVISATGSETSRDAWVSHP
jgi:hypothetical protein